MRSARLAAAALVGAVAIAACSGSSHSTSPTPAGHGVPLRAGPSADTTCAPQHFPLLSQATADRKARALVARMSLRQEVTMMHGVGLGGANGFVGSTTPIPALGIPALNQEDGPGGVGDFQTGVTQLPAPIALAATFDPAAARCYGQVIGEEARRKGIEVMYGPTVNLVRVPQWGRAFESLGEDPLLSGSMANSEIAGTQSAGVMAEAKHFAVYNQETFRNTPADNAIVGQRTLQELYLRVWRYVAAAHPAAVMCSYSTINSVAACQNRSLIRGFLDRLPGFHGFVAADFNATKSTVAAANAGLDHEQPTDLHFGKRLIAAVHAGTVRRGVVDEAVTQILAQMYRFRLFNDYPTALPHRVVTTSADAAIGRQVAAESTVLLKNRDQTLPLPGHGSIAVVGPAASTESAPSGAGTAHVVGSDSVNALQGLRARAPSGVTVSYTAGLPTSRQLTPIPTTALAPAYPSDGNTDAFTATLTAPETGTYVLGLTSGAYFSPVTLSVDGRVLFSDPDSPPARPYSASIRLIAGTTYRLAVSGQAKNLTWATPTTIAKQIAPAVAAASHASRAVVVVADPQESEATDRASLSLPSAQDDLVAAVSDANPHTVVVVEAGGAVTMPWVGKPAAIVDQFFAGQAGGTALADVLFGDVNPSGHLPVTFPRSESATPVATPEQYPGVKGRVDYSDGLNVGYRWWAHTNRRPLFPFGFGLSYSSFAYSRPSVTVATDHGQPVVTVHARITNTGKRSGADVAQIYLGSPAAGEPTRQLVAYRRVAIPAGQTQLVAFQIQGLGLASFVGGRWRVPAGQYRVYVGDSSALAQLTGHARFRLPTTTYPSIGP